MKADIFIHACLFLKQYIESHHIPYTQEEKRLIKTLDLLVLRQIWWYFFYCE